MKKEYPIRWKIYNWIYDMDVTICVTWMRIKDKVYWEPRWRWFDRYNCIEIPTLKPRYYDKPEIMLHGMFALLTDFMEIEKPYLPEYTEEDIKKEEYGSNPEWYEQQTNFSKEVKFLYNWWTVERPNRPEPYTEWHDYNRYIEDEVFPEFKESNHILSTFAISEKYPKHPDILKSEEIRKKAYKKEEDYHKEDEEMLIRLIKIRRGLWT